MVKTGTEATWRSTVSHGTTAVSDIDQLKKITFKKTDLKPFTSFKETANQFNQSITAYQKFNASDAGKMIQAGLNKTTDDQAGAAGIKTTGGH